MAKFGKRSTDKLNTCDERLIKIMLNVIKIYDFAVTCGHRPEVDQNKAYNSGASNAKWGESKHNNIPSTAIDIAPYNKGINWEDTESFTYLATLIFDEAQRQGVKIRWGGHFKSLIDMPHIELIENID